MGSRSRKMGSPSEDGPTPWTFEDAAVVGATLEEQTKLVKHLTSKVGKRLWQLERKVCDMQAQGLEALGSVTQQVEPERKIREREARDTCKDFSGELILELERKVERLTKQIENLDRTQPQKARANGNLSPCF